MSTTAVGAVYNQTLNNNMDLTFSVDIATDKDITDVGIKNVLDMSSPYKGLFFNIDASKNITFKYSNTNSVAIASTVADGTYYFRIRVTNYNVALKTGDVSVWYKTSDPGTSWGTATTTANSVNLNYTWNLGIFTSGSTTKNSNTLKNLFYINGGQIGTVLLSDIYNLVFDLETKEWSEYTNFTSSIKQSPIEYMSPSKDRTLNSAQYLGCQYTSQVALYTANNNFIGVFNQKGTTKDSSEFYIQSNAFNLETPNKKILREFYADFTPTDAVVTLYLQNDVNFGSDLTSIMSVRSGWNTVPRIYRGRQFKYGLKTTESDEFQLKQIGLRFDDLGQKAF